jgi:signal transduction histidine kinase/CHASE3 domain sensor protein
MQSGSLRTARASVFALAFFTLVAIAYLSDRAWRDYARSRAGIQAASQATRVNERLLGWVRDAETGERGYLLTGRPEYLAPYHQSLDSIDEDLKGLRELMKNRPRQLAYIDRLEQLINEKLAGLRLTIQTRDAKGAAAALAVMESGAGKRLMDGIRALSQEIQADADTQLASLRDAGREHATQARLVTLIGCGIVVLILFGAFLANEHSAKQRENLITELAAANRASAEVRDLLRTTLYSIGDAVITTDTEECVQLMNPMAERLTGFSESEARGKRLDEIFRPTAASRNSSASPQEPANLVHDTLKAASGTAPIFTSDAPIHLIQKSGSEMLVDASAAPIRDAADELRGVALVFRDVTERVHVEEQLRQTAKLESLGVLAGGIAHDFNNLLVGIVGNASLLEEYFQPGSAGRDLVSVLQSAGERAARLTQQMLAYSGRGRFVVQPVDLSHEVREISALVGASIPKHAELRLSTDRGLPPVEVDVTQLQQLIMNLVINGAEALGQKSGYVEVSTALRRIAANSVHDVLGRPLPAGRYVVLKVSDNGQGMDEATRARIFDPFFTTKFTGRGLGLAATLGIVKGHGGAIQVESEPGKGATFRVYFPVAITGNGGEPPPRSDAAVSPT